MCIYSAIYDFGKGIPQWDRNNFDNFKDLLDRAKKIDEQTGQPDCGKTDDKEGLLKEIEDKLKVKPQENTGWTCPKCAKVWSPQVDGCKKCNGDTNEDTAR